MSESELPIRVTLNSPRSQRFGLIVGACFIAAIPLFARLLLHFHLRTGWILALFTGFGTLCLGVQFVLLKRGRIELVLDEEGIWLEDRGRKGIAWANIAGYAFPPPPRFTVFRTPSHLKVWDHEGYTLVIPELGMPSTSKAYGSVLRELDRRVGPDGDRPALARNIESLPERMRHHHGILPTVELEPGIVYRYAHRADLRKVLRKNISDALCMIVPLLTFWPVLSIGFPVGSYVIMAALTPLVILYSFPALFQSIVLWKGMSDRFLRDETGIWILRKEGKILLSGAPRVKGTFMGQPLTLYGRGLLAYRIAPQFLEPDV